MHPNSVECNNDGHVTFDLISDLQLAEMVLPLTK